MPKKESKENNKEKNKSPPNKLINKESIVVFSAHSDDFVIGAGGTIANYAASGKKVTTIIFSAGEKSHPWLRKNVVEKMRDQEAINAGKLLGTKMKFLGLGDQRVYEDYQKKELQKKLLHFLNQEKPAKIFTHSRADHHSDHDAVHKITLELFPQLEFPTQLYLYSIWNPVAFKQQLPTFYVDITSFFQKKLQALGCFPSQRFNAIYPLMILILYRSFINGLKIKKRFAESFYRLK